MGHLGIEPRAFRLKAEYSTIELVTPLIKFNYSLFLVIYQKFKLLGMNEV